MSSYIPILCIRKRVRHVVETEPCPFCGQSHTHGAGTGTPTDKVYLGHRQDHCADFPLQRRGKRKGDLHGYFLVNLNPIKGMTEAMMRSLFAEMDAIADKLGWEPRTLRAALKCEFRLLQKACQPKLKTDQWQDLFSLWCDHYQSRKDAEREALPARIAALWEERRILLNTRDSAPPPQRAVADMRLHKIGMEMAQLVMPHEYTGPMAVWGSDAA